MSWIALRLERESLGEHRGAAGHGDGAERRGDMMVCAASWRMAATKPLASASACSLSTALCSEILPAA